MHFLKYISCFAAGFGAFSSFSAYAIPTPERNALIAFYNSTNGDTWINLSGWMGTPGTECGWHGITCDASSSHVVGISLQFNHLSGSLSSLCALPFLEVFAVDNNQLGAQIPSLSCLAGLKTFTASDNGGFGPQISGLSGSIPAVSGLNQLTTFDVSGNYLPDFPSVAACDT